MNQQQQALTANFSTEEIKTFETILNYYLNSNEPER